MSTFVQANRRAFNDFAAQYGSKPWQLQLTAQIRKALEDRKDWIEVPRPPSQTPTSKSDLGPVKLLDYACGTGAITKALGPYASSIRAIDISEKMVEQYNVAARASGLTAQQAQAVVGDLCAQDGVPKPLLAPGYFNFDIAAVCLGFHHFESPPLAVRRLAERLKPGSGVLLIIDFLPPELDKNRSRDHSHGHQQPAPTQRGGHQQPAAPQRGEHQQPASQQRGGHHHHDDHHAHAITTTGFTKDGLRTLYEDAGVGADFEFDVLPETAVLGNDEGSQRRKLFIAKGRRAAKQ